MDSVFQEARSKGNDIVLFRNKDILRGKLLNEKLTILTPYGEVTVPVQHCAGLSFEGARANTEAIVTVNYNRLTGIIKDRVLSFRIGTSGAEVEIRKEKVRHILLQKTPDELHFLKPGAAVQMFVMANGDLLTGLARKKDLSIQTDYGNIPVSFGEVRDIQMQGGEKVTAVVRKLNGDVMRGTLMTDEISIALAIGVEVASVYKDKFSRIVVDKLV